MHLEYTFQPSDQKQYIIPRVYNFDGAKDVWLSVISEVPKFAKFTVKKPSEGVLQSLRYSPIYKFDPTDCPLAETSIQVNGEGRKTSSVA